MITGHKKVKDMVIRTANMGGVEKATTCMYRGNKRYCNITTHQTCRRCRFYEPTTAATFEAAAFFLTKYSEQAKRMKRERKTLDAIAYRLDELGLKYTAQKVRKTTEIMKEIY